MNSLIRTLFTFLFLVVPVLAIAQPAYKNVLAIGVFDELRVPRAARLVDSFTMHAPFQSWGRAPYKRLLDSARSNAVRIGGNMVEVVTYDNMYRGAKWRSGIKVRVYWLNDEVKAVYLQLRDSLQQVHDAALQGVCMVHIKSWLTNQYQSRLYFNDTPMPEFEGESGLMHFKRHWASPHIDTIFAGGGTLRADISMGVQNNKASTILVTGREYYLILRGSTDPKEDAFVFRAVDKDEYDNDN